MAKTVADVLKLVKESEVKFVDFRGFFGHRRRHCFRRDRLGHGHKQDEHRGLVSKVQNATA